MKLTRLRSSSLELQFLSVFWRWVFQLQSNLVENARFGSLDFHFMALRPPCFDGNVLVDVLRIQKWARVLVLAASRECSTCDTQKVHPLPNSWSRCSKGPSGKWLWMALAESLLFYSLSQPCTASRVSLPWYTFSRSNKLKAMSSSYGIVKCCILPVVISRNPVVITVVIAKNL